MINKIYIEARYLQIGENSHQIRVIIPFFIQINILITIDHQLRTLITSKYANMRKRVRMREWRRDSKWMNKGGRREFKAPKQASMITWPSGSNMIWVNIDQIPTSTDSYQSIQVSPKMGWLTYRSVSGPVCTTSFLSFQVVHQSLLLWTIIADSHCLIMWSSLNNKEESHCFSAQLYVIYVTKNLAFKGSHSCGFLSITYLYDILFWSFIILASSRQCHLSFSH